MGDETVTVREWFRKMRVEDFNASSSSFIDLYFRNPLPFEWAAKPLVGPIRIWNYMDLVKFIEESIADPESLGIHIEPIRQWKYLEGITE
jgi:hypothetical protein